ncbi:hypothetical protein N7474_009527 [Penicillium riverlandense]|uniref:uncharacterized protein n=1 Tax=Penicillium riverlandense TaxID=1903569 RepID=UPI0025474C67|nr:uncharacterized protein N7474_009527 [Penicillium riverlandense]KAJ5808258.1 hypothetical protein N7474_009527 [Penicillium riverlandense]
MDPLTPNCRKVASPGIFQPILSILIVFGILISYLPQHIRIVTLRSSFGISPYFVLLGVTSGTSTFANILVTPATARDVGCCQEVNATACFAALLGIFQMGMQWLCFFSMYAIYPLPSSLGCTLLTDPSSLLLFVIYFPRATSPTSPLTPAGPTYRTALVITAICILHALVVVIISAAFALREPSALKHWADFLGILAAILASIQYLPQLYTTFRLRCVGSFSIPMMCIQTPGSLVWAASLAARQGPGGWSTWGPLVVTACLQGSLLFMAIYFEYFGPNSKRKAVHEADEHGAPSGEAAEQEPTPQHAVAADRPSEETPLLQSQ